MSLLAVLSLKVSAILLLALLGALLTAQELPGGYEERREGHATGVRFQRPPGSGMR